MDRLPGEAKRLSQAMNRHSSCMTAHKQKPSKNTQKTLHAAVLALKVQTETHGAFLVDMGKECKRFEELQKAINVLSELYGVNHVDDEEADMDIGEEEHLT